MEKENEVLESTEDTSPEGVTKPAALDTQHIHNFKYGLYGIGVIVAVLVFVILYKQIVGRQSYTLDPSSTTPTPTLAQPTPTPEIEEPRVYAIVDTGQSTCYSNTAEASCNNATFPGQDGAYIGNEPSFTDNSDGTVTDNVTGLMWQKDPGNKITYSQAVVTVSSFSLAGYNDWRLPTIKELYSLIDFRGGDPSGLEGDDTSGLTPFINQSVFDFAYGDTNVGDRIIDSQWATSTLYQSTVMGDQRCMFGVNFADGRIKCYPLEKTFYVIYVRGDVYEDNSFEATSDDVVTDTATGLMWQRTDSQKGLIWADALTYCNNLSLDRYADWRLPNAKELQSIIDYSRSPDTTSSAAIDPLFETSTITNEANEQDYPFYWASTTHLNSGGNATHAAYVSFGRAMGYMNGQWMDVHGAGAQRSDPKTGDPSEYPTGHGPQGDAIRIYNYARCVRGTSPTYNGQATIPTTFTVQPTVAITTSPMPTQANEQQSQTPPQEAVSACSEKGEGISCSFVSPQGDTITGSCHTANGTLACVPKN